MEERGHHKKLTKFVALVMSKLPKFVAFSLYSMVKNQRGSISMGLRYVCIKRLAASCGENVAIFPYVTLKSIEKMHFGDNVSIHTMCYIDAIAGVEIGSNVSIAHQTSLVSFDHTYSDITIPIKYNVIKKGKITIKDDVWIGCGCRVLKGVTINSRCIIAAGAVVINNTEANCLYGGVPAKMIKKII